MSDTRPILALVGRAPDDAIVQATMVPNLDVAGICPSSVTFLHTAVTTGSQSDVFGEVRSCGSGSAVWRNLRLVLAARRELRLGGVETLYVRDVLTALMARAAMLLAWRRPTLVFDCRGDVVAEARLQRKPRSRRAVLRWLQDSAVRRADRTMTVSEAMARHIRALGQTNVVVVPNFQREVAGGRSDSSSRPLVVFAGGGQAWQGAEEALDSLNGLRQRGIDVEVITRDDQLAEQARARGMAVSSGDREHVMSRLSVATGSWMVRKAAGANAVASPVKLGEALSAGALVIGSKATWEGMEALAAASLAILVDPVDPELDDLAGRLHESWESGSRSRTLRLDEVERNWTLRSKAKELAWFFGQESAGLSTSPPAEHP